MQKLVYILFLIIFSFDFMNRYGLPRAFTWMPEIISLITAVALVLLGARKKYVHLSFFYWGMFLLICLHIVFGAIINDVPLTAFFSGVRTFFKFAPFFLLPAFYKFSDVEITKQLKLLLALCLIQLPISIYQRFFEVVKYKGDLFVGTDYLSGDNVRGLLDTSGHLSMFMICAVSFLFACYLKKQIPTKTFLLSIVVMLIPTMLNESKASLILLPIALIAPAIVASNGVSMYKRLLGVSLLLVLFVAIFVPVYDHFMKPRWGYGLLDFITMEGRVEGYLYHNEKQIARGNAGRFGNIAIAQETLSKDPIKLFFGLGVGNVSLSFLGERFSGEYYNEYGMHRGATFSHLLWEVGWAGLCLMIILFIKISKDAFYLREKNGVIGAVGLGWFGVMAVFLLALLYKNTISSNIIGVLFWYFSGYVAAATAEHKTKISNHQNSNKYIQTNNQTVNN